MSSRNPPILLGVANTDHAGRTCEAFSCELRKMACGTKFRQVMALGFMDAEALEGCFEDIAFGVPENAPLVEPSKFN